jgi:hypothetical protein
VSVTADARYNAVKWYSRSTPQDTQPAHAINTETQCDYIKVFILEFLPILKSFLTTKLYRCLIISKNSKLSTGRLCSLYQRSVIFSNLPNPSGRTMALGSTQPLTEMSTRNLNKETWG